MPDPRYSITYKPSAAKSLRKIDRQHQQAIITAIDALAHQPRPDGVKNFKAVKGNTA